MIYIEYGYNLNQLKSDSFLLIYSKKKVVVWIVLHLPHHAHRSKGVGCLECEVRSNIGFESHATGTRLAEEAHE